jgi:hypothetical protein
MGALESWSCQIAKAEGIFKTSWTSLASSGYYVV